MSAAALGKSVQRLLLGVTVVVPRWNFVWMIAVLVCHPLLVHDGF